MDFQPKTFRKQIPINITSNVALFILNVGIGIWLVPYLINHLGIASYGLIPLATSIAAYMVIVAISFNGAVSRYLTIDLQKKDSKKANRTFNTALFGSLGFVLLIFPIVTLFSYFVPNILNITVGQDDNVRLFFFMIMGTFLVTIISSNFAVSSFAYNRFDLRNIAYGCGQITKVFLIVLLFATFSPHLWHVGISYLGGSLIAFGGAVWAWRKLTPQLKIQFSSFDRYQLGKLTGMGGWMFINQIGALLFLNIDLIIVNKLCGAKYGGQYAIILLWVVFFRSMASILASLLTPIILTYYARNQIEQIIKVSKNTIKFLGLTIALPIGLICGFASPLLSVWIGPKFSHLAPLMWLLVGHLCINLAILPIFSIQLSFNKVCVPGIVTLFMGIGNILLAIFFVIVLSWGMYGVAIAGAIFLTLKNAIFTAWYGSRIINKRWYTFIVSMLPGIISALVIGIISFWISYYFTPSNWITLLLYFGIIGLAYVLITFFVVLKPNDRNLLFSLISTRA